MTSAFRWAWFLSLALFAPVGLPAGGAELSIPNIRRREGSALSIAMDSFLLRSSPLETAPVLRKLDIGTPVSILRYWQSENGTNWIQVQIRSGEVVSLTCTARRGWVNV